MKRRRFLKNSSLLTFGFTMGLSNSRVLASSEWRMPEESEAHERTWMAFGASQKIWGRRLLPEVQRNLADIANVIAKYEPVSMLVRPGELELARSLISPSVDLIECPLDDLWVRDTGPTMVTNDSGEMSAVDFNFNGWGEKQAHFYDQKVAAFIAQELALPLINTELVLEGGCFEVDGSGTAIITESCVLNDNRNSGISKAEFEDVFMPLLGLQKIIWLPGIKGKDITDGHTDFYARFAKPGVVLAGYEPDKSFYDHEITLQHLEILESATDANGKKLDVKVLEAPTFLEGEFVSDDYAAGYIGYYVCNGAVIMQKFGDANADQKARKTIQTVFQDRSIEQLRIDGIAAGGGSIHCATQQQPKQYIS